MAAKKDFPLGSVALMGFACVLAVLAACTTVTRGTAPDSMASGGFDPGGGTAASRSLAPQLDWGEKPVPPTLGFASDPNRFIGAKPEFLLSELGEPATLRKEAPAEIWQYRAERCILDIFLYEEADGPAVVYLEARDLTAAPAATDVCLDDLLSIAELSDS